MSQFFISCKESRIESNKSFYGCFYLGPFEPSQSLTIANALRRTLLSEIYGLGIVSVEIEGATHEYSSLSGVRDSVLDILLNLKEIVLKKTIKNFKPQIGYLRVRGPGVVRASHLRLPPFLQCIDPDQYIATLSDNGFLNMKFIIQYGSKFSSFTVCKPLLFVPKTNPSGSPSYGKPLASPVPVAKARETIANQKDKDFNVSYGSNKPSGFFEGAMNSDNKERKRSNILASANPPGSSKGLSTFNLHLKKRHLILKKLKQIGITKSNTYFNIFAQSALFLSKYKKKSTAKKDSNRTLFKTLRVLRTVPKVSLYNIVAESSLPFFPTVLPKVLLPKGSPLPFRMPTYGKARTPWVLALPMEANPPGSPILFLRKEELQSQFGTCKANTQGLALLAFPKGKQAPLFGSETKQSGTYRRQGVAKEEGVLGSVASSFVSVLLRKPGGFGSTCVARARALPTVVPCVSSEPVLCMRFYLRYSEGRKQNPPASTKDRIRSKGRETEGEVASSYCYSLRRDGNPTFLLALGTKQPQSEGVAEGKSDGSGREKNSITPSPSGFSEGFFSSYASTSHATTEGKREPGGIRYVNPEGLFQGQQSFLLSHKYLAINLNKLPIRKKLSKSIEKNEILPLLATPYGKPNPPGSSCLLLEQSNRNQKGLLLRSESLAKARELEQSSKSLASDLVQTHTGGMSQPSYPFEKPGGFVSVALESLKQNARKPGGLGVGRFSYRRMQEKGVGFASTKNPPGSSSYGNNQRKRNLILKSLNVKKLSSSSNALTIDAVFNPINKVNYIIETAELKKAPSKMQTSFEISELVSLDMPLNKKTIPFNFKGHNSSAPVAKARETVIDFFSSVEIEKDLKRYIHNQLLAEQQITSSLASVIKPKIYIDEEVITEILEIKRNINNAVATPLPTVVRSDTEGKPGGFFVREIPTTVGIRYEDTQSEGKEVAAQQYEGMSGANNITLEIWTNGSIHPRDALYQGFKNLLKLFSKLKKIKPLQGLITSGVSYETKWQVSVSKEQEKLIDALPSDCFSPTKRKKNPSIRYFRRKNPEGEGLDLLPSVFVPNQKEFGTPTETLYSNSKEGRVSPFQSVNLSNNKPSGFFPMEEERSELLKKIKMTSFTEADLLRPTLLQDLLPLNKTSFLSTYVAPKLKNFYVSHASMPSISESNKNFLVGSLPSDTERCKSTPLKNPEGSCYSSLRRKQSAAYARKPGGFLSTPLLIRSPLRFFRRNRRTRRVCFLRNSKKQTSGGGQKALALASNLLGTNPSGSPSVPYALSPRFTEGVVPQGVRRLVISFISASTEGKGEPRRVSYRSTVAKEARDTIVSRTSCFGTKRKKNRSENKKPFGFYEGREELVLLLPTEGDKNRTENKKPSGFSEQPKRSSDIGILNLSLRSYTCLKRFKINTVEELITLLNDQQRFVEVSNNVAKKSSAFYLEIENNLKKLLKT